MGCRQCGESFEPTGRQIYCTQLCRNRRNSQRAKSKPPTADEHGTPTGYIRGCRCDDCRASNASYSALVRSRQPKRPRKVRSDKGVRKPSRTQHGTRSHYAVHKCRCAPCSAAAVESTRQWRLVNVEKTRRHNQQSRLKRLAAPYDESALRYRELIINDPCVYCGRASTSVDHIRPVHRGGASIWDNLAPACGKCNSRKGGEELLEYLMYVQLHQTST